MSIFHTQNYYYYTNTKCASNFFFFWLLLPLCRRFHAPTTYYKYSHTLSFILSHWAKCNTTTSRATRFNAGKTCCWCWRTKIQVGNLDPIIKSSYALLPLLETIITYPNLLTLFPGSTLFTRWGGTEFAVHLAQKTWPQSRQWCLRLNVVNWESHL